MTERVPQVSDRQRLSPGTGISHDEDSVRRIQCGCQIRDLGGVSIRVEVDRQLVCRVVERRRSERIPRDLGGVRIDCCKLDIGIARREVNRQIGRASDVDRVLVNAVKIDRETANRNAAFVNVCAVVAQSCNTPASCTLENNLVAGLCAIASIECDIRELGQFGGRTQVNG